MLWCLWGEMTDGYSNTITSHFSGSLASWFEWVNNGYNYNALPALYEELSMHHLAKKGNVVDRCKAGKYECHISMISKINILIFNALSIALSIVSILNIRLGFRWNTSKRNINTYLRYHHRLTWCA